MGCEWNRGQLLEDVGFEGKEAVAGGWTAVGGRVLPETWGRSRCCSRGGLLSGPSWPWWGASPHSRFMEEGFICDCVADEKTGSDNRWKRKDLNETPSPPS